MVKQLLIAISFFPTMLAAQDMAALPEEALAYLGDNTAIVASPKAETRAAINSRIENGRSEAEVMLIVSCNSETPLIMQVLDESGRPTRVFRQLQLEAGEHEIPVELNSLNPGSYLISLQAPNQRASVVHRVYKR